MEGASLLGWHEEDTDWHLFLGVWIHWPLTKDLYVVRRLIIVCTNLIRMSQIWEVLLLMLYKDKKNPKTFVSYCYKWDVVWWDVVLSRMHCGIYTLKFCLKVTVHKDYIKQIFLQPVICVRILLNSAIFFFYRCNILKYWVVQPLLRMTVAVQFVTIRYYYARIIRLDLRKEDWRKKAGIRHEWKRLVISMKQHNVWVSV